MKAVLVFIDGTICDTRHRHHMAGTPDFHKREEILKDHATPGSVTCLQEIARRHSIVYMGARPSSTLPYTKEWLDKMGFPEGHVILASSQVDRVALVKDLSERFDFTAGIGDRWDDNELHLEIGCLSIILKEYEGNWDIVHKHLLR
jgi:uncharacterized HAD superfamily protein